MNEKELSSNSNNLLDFNVIKVELTYEDFPTFLFKFRRQLSKELVKFKDDFYGLTPTEQLERQEAQRAEMLSKLYVEHSNFPALDIEKTPEEAFFEYFVNPENLDILTYIWTIYQRKLYPKEVFETPSD